MKIETKLSKQLIKNNETISTMESCTGGYIASTITNAKGASEIIKCSLVTYSNEFKIKFGVKKETIDKYSVYSEEVARQMSKSVSEFTGSTYAIGVTGKINRVDVNNEFGNDNEVFVAIYNSKNNSYKDIKLFCPNKSRVKVKKYITKIVLKNLFEISKK